MKHFSIFCDKKSFKVDLVVLFGTLKECWSKKISKRNYSKALRSTFLGERKNLCSSIFVQLLLLNRVKARWSENCAAQGFHFINLFISNFFGPNSENVHLRGPCSSRLCISRPYCIEKRWRKLIEIIIFSNFLNMMKLTKTKILQPYF